MNLRSSITPTFCPGCHNFIVSASIQKTVENLNIKKENLVLVFDIGCVGNMADFYSTYGIHSLHGRCLPTAIGVKLANPKLTVIAVGGDGGIYGEGLNHLLAAARLNADITVLVADNHLYSLTTGQTSPTTPQGSKTKSTPLGAPALAINPVSLVKSVNSTVFASSVDCRQPLAVSEAITKAVSHSGFSLLNLEQICITFGKQLAA